MPPLLPGLNLLFCDKRIIQDLLHKMKERYNSRVEENDEQKTSETEKRKDQDL